MVPFIFRTSLDTNRPALPYLVLHSLLEEFLPPYYYSAASAPLQQFLVHARQFRNSAVKGSPTAIVKTHLQLVHGQDFKLDTSEVHFYVFGFISLFLFCQLCANAPSYLQLPNLLPKLFLSYLEHTPCSKFIYNEFLSLIFTKFSISEDLQTDFQKWAKKVVSLSNKVPMPVSIVHPSQEFKALTPLGIVDLLPKKSKNLPPNLILL